MALNLSAADTAFRNEVRAFVRESLPPEIKRKVETYQSLGRDDYLAWQRILYERGWMAPAWPVELGGTGWTPIQHYIFEEECHAGSAPRIVPFGVKMLAPVLMRFGNESQKGYYLPRILRSEDWWCQGYSEPGAGSDLAALGTRAVRDGDHYLVTGQKTWTTLAQHADMMFCLVRTSDEGKRQEGISFLLIDMRDAGVTVHPIRTFDGGWDINDVFFDRVRVPVSNRVGEENKGWTYAKFLLGHERTNIAGIGWSKQRLRALKDIAAAERLGEGALLDDARFRGRMAEVEIELRALETIVLGLISGEGAGRPPGPEASLLKIKGTEIQQAVAELAAEAIAYYAIPLPSAVQVDLPNEPPIGPDYAAPLAPLYFNWRKSSIYGGTNEIQKNIMAKFVLGL
jgi:alkylation response protein AidB-like acyl-CoA dehydrogenase